MSLTVAPFEQVAAEALTGLIITGGQNGNAANIVKRATTALAIVAAFNAINSGNAAAGIAAIQAALSNANMDPGVNLALQGLFSIGSQMLALNANIAAGLPLVGTTIEAVVTNISAGVTAAANAEIAKYGTPQPAASP
jgi:hypothetical protein